MWKWMGYLTDSRQQALPVTRRLVWMEGWEVVMEMWDLT